MKDWIASNPFFASLVVVLAVAVPGYIRQEYTIEEAHSAAYEAQSATASLELVVSTQTEERIERRRELCQRDVIDQLNDRAMWEYVFGPELRAFDPANPIIGLVLKELERRLPKLVCNAEDVPVPIPSIPSED